MVVFKIGAYLLMVLTLFGVSLFALDAKTEKKIMKNLVGNWECRNMGILFEKNGEWITTNGTWRIAITEDKTFSLTISTGYKGPFVISNISKPKKGIIVIDRPDSEFNEVYEYTVKGKNKVGFRSIGDEIKPHYYTRRKKAKSK